MSTDKRKSNQLMELKKGDRIHFVGIGGAGMSCLAQVYTALGYEISGSDIKESANTKSLEKTGARVYIGHDVDNVEGASVVVVSSAIRDDNPEVIQAEENDIPVIQRAELLAILMRLKRGIAVAGTHGKTTTTSMIGRMLEDCGEDPTYLIGGELNDIGSGARSGKGEFLVAEADESDASLLNLDPEIAVVTNIEADHLDFYKSLAEIEDVFHRFLEKIPDNGYAVLCYDDPNIRRLIPKLTCKFRTYGFEPDADYVAQDIRLTSGETTFQVLKDGKEIGRASLKVPGLHNVYNALGTIAVGLELGLDFQCISAAVASFGGVRRRFQQKGIESKITVVDDYAHHPSEVLATLDAARTGEWNRIISVFQPHRYSRTHCLHEAFGRSFGKADIVIITDVYAADEEPIPGVDGKLVVDSILMSEPHKDIAYLPKKTDVSQYLLGMLDEGDLLLTLGAGDVWVVGEEVLSGLRLEADKDPS